MPREGALAAAVAVLGAAAVWTVGTTLAAWEQDPARAVEGRYLSLQAAAVLAPAGLVLLSGRSRIGASILAVACGLVVTAVWVLPQGASRATAVAVVLAAVVALATPRVEQSTRGSRHPTWRWPWIGIALAIQALTHAGLWLPGRFGAEADEGPFELLADVGQATLAALLAGLLLAVLARRTGPIPALLLLVASVAAQGRLGVLALVTLGIGVLALDALTPAGLLGRSSFASIPETWRRIAAPPALFAAPVLVLLALRTLNVPLVRNGSLSLRETIVLGGLLGLVALRVGPLASARDDSTPSGRDPAGLHGRLWPAVLIVGAAILLVVARQPRSLDELGLGVACFAPLALWMALVHRRSGEERSPTPAASTMLAVLGSALVVAVVGLRVLPFEAALFPPGFLMALGPTGRDARRDPERSGVDRHTAGSDSPAPPSPWGATVAGVLGLLLICAAHPWQRSTPLLGLGRGAGAVLLSAPVERRLAWPPRLLRQGEPRLELEVPSELCAGPADLWVDSVLSRGESLPRRSVVADVGIERLPDAEEGHVERIAVAEMRSGTETGDWTAWRRAGVLEASRGPVPWLRFVDVSGAFFGSVYRARVTLKAEPSSAVEAGGCRLIVERRAELPEGVELTILGIASRP